MKLIKSVLIFVNIVLIAIFVQFFVADTKAKNIDYLVKELEFTQALESANQALNLNSREPYYFRQRAKVYILLAAQENTDQAVYKEQALKDLQAAYALNTENLATIRNSIPYYYFLAKANMSLKQHANVKAGLDEEYAQTTRTFYKTTKNRFPTDAGVIATIAKYEKLLGFDDDYEDSINALKKLRPDLLEWYPGIAY